jgi:hypothetical protein
MDRRVSEGIRRNEKPYWPVICSWRFRIHFALYTDASDYQMGASWSKKLNPAQQQLQGHGEGE